MAKEVSQWHRPRSWIILIGVVIVLIFLYFYQPFENYLAASIPNIRFSNIIFWFASLVGVIAYAIAHWDAFKRHIVRSGNELQTEALVFDILQAAIMTAVIFTAGATLQALVMLSRYLMGRGEIFNHLFGEKILAIVLLIILAIVFYLLHQVVRSIRHGWHPRRPPPRVTSSSD